MIAAARRLTFLGSSLTPATWVTLCSVVLGGACVALAHHGNLPLAAIALIAAGVCDLFDGAVARRFTMTEEQASFGVQIDSIADMASFGVAPMFLLMHAGVEGVGATVGMFAYMVAAALRLAYFNTHGVTVRGGRGYYCGLPVTYAAIVFPILLLVSTIDGEASSDLHRWPLVLGIWAVAFAFVARIPIPKPGGSAYIVLSFMAVFFIALWAMRLF